ncbi:MAG: sigma 54-interacting transcriptional regulator [Deltaproteobacteria bacterium]|nr:sigma 54-interacting transcriptional regulator [Deltaproteobacteria bacterium]
MGRVALVTDTCAGGVPLAAKLLEHAELRADFLAEVELLRRLAHPGFPAVHGLVVEAGASGRTFVLLERLEGRPLGPDRATDARPHVVEIAGDLARALDHLHRHGRVHGDLAPGNVLWRPGAGPRLLDLGAGGARGERSGRASGVLAYQPPERLSGAGLAPTGDLWSLGALLFGLVHGRHPFPGWPASGRIDEGPARAGLAPHALDRLLDRLLAADPSARYPSAAAFAADLEATTGSPQPLAVTLGPELPFIDVPSDAGDRIVNSLVDRIERARGREAVTVDLAGDLGTGRSRLLNEVAMRLAARGVPVIAAPSLDDDPTAWVAALLGQLGHDLDGLGRALETIARAGVVVIVDDLDRLPRVREVAARLRAAVRWSTGALVSVGLGPAELSLPRWTARETEALLDATFPRRLVSARASGPITEASHGHPGRVVALVRALVASGRLVVDSANVTLGDPKEAFLSAAALAPEAERPPPPERARPTSTTEALRSAEALAAAGQERDALVDARRGLELAHSDDERRAAWLSIGRLEARASRFPRALEAFSAARALRADADVLAGLARAAAMSGDLASAEEVTAEGLALVGPAELGLRAALLYTQALVAWYRGELEVAEPRLAAALEAARAAGERAEEAAIVTALGLIVHRRGDLATAAQRYREALRLGEAARDEARVLSSLQNLGVVFHERGEWTEALDTYRQALSLAEALDQRGRVAQIAGNLGNLWRYLGELERAEAVLGRARAIAHDDGNRHLESLVDNLLGDVASDRGDLVAAEQRYASAIAVGEAAGCHNEALEARVNLARLLVERGELARAAREAEATLAQIGPTQDGLAALALSALAQIRRREGADAEAAATRCREAVARAAGAKNPDMRWPVLLEAAIAARERGELDEAERFARELRAVLQGQLDAVPPAHRDAFRGRRDRRVAWRETAALVAPSPARREPGGGDRSSLGWSRLLEVHKRLASEHNVQRLLEYIMDSAILLTGAERGFLLLDARGGPKNSEATKEGFEVRVARNIDQENIRNRHLKISRGIARRVIEGGEPIITVDAMEDERYKEQLSVHDLRLRSILCLPMAFRGRVLGAIYLDNRFRPSAFADEDVRFMEAFADMAAIALDNARLVESLEAGRKDLEAARREVEGLARRLEEELAARTRELEESREAIAIERRTLAVGTRYDNIIGSSASLRKVFAMIDRLRATDIPVLIEGESGTGKELVARAIHFSGPRKERPFVAVNCGAIPAMLLESELFGHVRGAFTSATSDKKGLFEVAHTGTLLLDEIGELPLEMQVKLLRVLQSGDIQKVGATRQVTVDVRVLAATNRNLQEEVAAGRFREDLYYRLSVVPILIPPLRQRVEDIPLLVQHFIDANRKAGLGNVTAISKDAMTLLQRYTWPGNVRQLEMVLKNASVFADGATLTAKDFASFPDLVGSSVAAVPTSGGALMLAGRTLAELERAAIVACLRDNKGNKKRTAEILGIDRRTLYNKLAAYEIAIEQDLKVS